MSYLTVQRGKHRILEQTPLEDRYAVLPFNGIGGLLDDVNGEDTSLTKPGGPRVADVRGGNNNANNTSSGPAW